MSPGVALKIWLIYQFKKMSILQKEITISRFCHLDSRNQHGGKTNKSHKEVTRAKISQGYSGVLRLRKLLQKVHQEL